MTTHNGKMNEEEKREYQEYLRRTSEDLGKSFERMLEILERIDKKLDMLEGN